MGLLDQIAARLKDLRVTYNNGEGLSQEVLARNLGVAPNTISRWETGTYIPSITDLEKITRFFGVSIHSFFPSDIVNEDEDESLKALLRTASQLHPADLEELKNYAEFRKARGIYEGKTRPKAGRKRSKQK